MGFFDSDSTVNNETRTNNLMFSELGEGNYSAILGENNRIQMTDQGALKVAENIALESMSQIESAGQNTANIVGQAVGAMAESDRSETENIVGQLKSVAVMAVIAWAAVGFARSLKA